MPTKKDTRENNRANEDNQSTRHHHTPGAGSRFPAPGEQPEQQGTSEYYPAFDKTGKGVNPEKKITKERP